MPFTQGRSARPEKYLRPHVGTSWRTQAGAVAQDVHAVLGARQEHIDAVLLFEEADGAMPAHRTAQE